MNTNLKRRDFFKKTAQAGMACCALMATSKLGAFNNLFLEGEELDPKLMNYCGYKCPEDCTFLKGSLENDIQLKKEAYKEWQIKERFGIEFEADKIFCFGCKTKDKPEGVVLQNCTVRSCVIEKELDCCIECKELTTCEKELWDRFPTFKEKVIEMQQTYLAGKY